MARRARTLAFAATMVATAAATAAGIVLGANALDPAPAGANGVVCGFAAAESPDAVRDLFVTTAVLRRRAACSYELVTASMRQGVRRAAWRVGSIPVIPFPTHAPRTLRIDVIPRTAGPRSRTSLVVLSAADLGEATFEVTLVRRGERWLVDYWAPAGVVVAPTAA